MPTTDRKNNEDEFTKGWEEYYQQSLNKPAWKKDSSPLVNMFMMKYNIDLSLLHVADYGSGDGRNLWPWVKAQAHVTAVDIAPSALRQIAMNSIEQKLTCPTLVCTNIEELPLAENQFDVAQCLDALPQVNDPQKALAEIAKTLRPGAKFLFNIFTPKDCAFGEGEKIQENAFVYKNTLFRFFEDQDIRDILPRNLDIIECVPQTWEDPPHIPFRPYAHTHDGVYYICQKKGG